MGNAFNSFSEITGSARQELALENICKHLDDGGTFVCTLYNTDY